MEFVPTDEESTEIKQLAEIKKMAYDLHMKKTKMQKYIIWIIKKNTNNIMRIEKLR